MLSLMIKHSNDSVQYLEISANNIFVPQKDTKEHYRKVLLSLCGAFWNSSVTILLWKPRPAYSTKYSQL